MIPDVQRFTALLVDAHAFKNSTRRLHFANATVAVD
jgi:hypothetical protein